MQPVAVIQGVDKIIRYVNHAFCRMVHKSQHEIIGQAFQQFAPTSAECQGVLDRVQETGRAQTHTERIRSEPVPLFWSYEAWPTESYLPLSSSAKVAIRITETSYPHDQANQLDTALNISAAHQNELLKAGALNERLQTEIAEHRRVDAEIEQLAYYDQLTDLPNRRLLMDRLHHATLASSRTMQIGAVLFIDLDHFKRLNDTKGHHVGDLMLQQLAIRLKLCVREVDTVARLGGDEFVVLLKELSQEKDEAHAQAIMVADKILVSLNQSYLLAGHEHWCTASIGIALFGSDRESVTELLSCADLAQYRAKAAGGNAIQFFDRDMQVKAAARSILEADLRQALSGNQFRLCYHPVVNGEGQLTGAEALLRWQHPSRGLLSPSEFIEFAEEHGIIEPIGQWVLEKASQQLVAWSRRSETSHLTLAVNVSAREFANGAFVNRLLTIVDRHGADSTKLVLELTERSMFKPLKGTLAKMNLLKARGISFALDDFGVGFSSLACLKHLPVAFLKIDRSFIRDMLTSSADNVIVKSVINLGHSLGLSVIAEGVESKEQLGALAAYGCDSYQGYLFGKPLSAERLSSTLRPSIRESMASV